LLQHPDDLLLREPALPHLLSSSGFYTLENSRLHWYCFRGAGHLLLDIVPNHMVASAKNPAGLPRQVAERIYRRDALRSAQG